MPGKLGVVWLWHAHQPVGERDAVVEQACAERYVPVIAALAAHPAVRVGLHWSGPLSEWIAARHPELVAQLRALVARGQVELIGGGLGAPRMAEVPLRDRVGQIRAMRAHLERTYGGRVTGAWFSDWEFAALTAGPLIDSGVEWAPHFGLGANQPAPTPVTLLQADGRTLRLFAQPGGVHFAGGAEHLEGHWSRLRQLAAEGYRGLAIGVRLDLWKPGMAAAAVESIARAEWIESLTPGAGLDRWRAERSATAVDVGWSEFAPSREMLDARLRVVSDRCALLPPGRRAADEARRHLYRAEGHLPDGDRGLGRPRLRSALVASALRAERLARETLGAEIPRLEVRTADLNADGRDEVLLQTPAIATIVVPHRGGHIAVLDDLRAGCDWLVPYRWDAERWPREAAVDRILPEDAGAETLAGGDPCDESDLSTGVYAARVATSPDEARVVLARAGTWRRGYAGRPVRVEKELRCAAGAGALELRYRVTGGGEGADTALFVSEWNLGLVEPDSDDRRLRGPDGTDWGPAGARCDHAAEAGVDAVDEARGTRVCLRSDRPVRVVTWPVDAVDRYQATAVALCVPMSLGGDRTTEFTVTATLAAP